MDEENIICAEVLLAKYFMDFKTGKAGEIISWVKSSFRGPGLRKKEIREARKRLGIKSQSTEDGYTWSWGNEKDPEEMWKLKGRGFYAGGRH